MSRYMTEEVNKKARFRLDSCRGRGPSQLAADGYDGLIDVKLKEIYFQREGTSDKVRIYVRGTGKLTKLAGRSVVWGQRDIGQELVIRALRNMVRDITMDPAFLEALKQCSQTSAKENNNS